MDTLAGVLELLQGIWLALALVAFFWMLFTGRASLKRLRKGNWWSWFR